MHWGVRAFFFVLLASGAFEAAATTPPLTEDEEASQVNLQNVQDALAACGKAATRARVAGVVEID
jgi:hypothetical protein